MGGRKLFFSLVGSIHSLLLLPRSWFRFCPCCCCFLFFPENVYEGFAAFAFFFFPHIPKNPFFVPPFSVKKRERGREANNFDTTIAVCGNPEEVGTDKKAIVVAEFPYFSRKVVYSFDAISPRGASFLNEPPFPFSPPTFMPQWSEKVLFL